MALDPGALRSLDVGFNRAREAARTLEDVARFALADARWTDELKRIRHALRDIAAGVDRSALLASRDVASDVGARVPGPGSGDRATLAHVAAAAAARLAEALRSLEEHAKLAGLDAAAIERLRFRAYDVERALGLALAGGRGPQARLCVLITESLCAHQSWRRVAELAIEAGADALQLREKTLPDGELLARARWLVDAARAAPTPPAVFINDRPDIALMARATGVHLGRDDLPIAAVRALAGEALRVGLSTAGSATDVRAARDAADAGADYIALGPMFPTTTKPDRPASGPGYLAAVLADPVASRVPHLAIGGITPENAGELARRGVRGVAVSACVCGAREPGEVCRRLLALVPARNDGP